jgi:hypothetical protein
MKVYTYSEARQKLAAVLEQARTEGEVRIRRNDGQCFVLRPMAAAGSPLAVEGVDLGLTRDEIVAAVHEGRRDMPPR